MRAKSARGNREGRRKGEVSPRLRAKQGGASTNGGKEGFVVAERDHRKKARPSLRRLCIYRSLCHAQTSPVSANRSRARVSGGTGGERPLRGAAAEAPSRRASSSPLFFSFFSKGSRRQTKAKAKAAASSLSISLSLSRPSDDEAQKYADVPGQKGALRPRLRCEQRPCLSLSLSLFVDSALGDSMVWNRELARLFLFAPRRALAPRLPASSVQCAKNSLQQRSGAGLGLRGRGREGGPGEAIKEKAEGWTNGKKVEGSECARVYFFSLLRRRQRKLLSTPGFEALGLSPPPLLALLLSLSLFSRPR